MEIKIGSDGGKSCQVTITGSFSSTLPEPEPILFFENLRGYPRSLRLDGVQFLIQEKMGLKLWWVLSKGPPMQLKLLLPVESRGAFDFEKIQSIHSPEGAIGLALTPFNITETDMSFFLMLDLAR